MRVCFFLLTAVAGVSSFVVRFHTSFNNVESRRCFPEAIHDAINDQPPVLVKPDNAPPPLNWTGKVAILQRNNVPGLLPFVDRVKAVTDMVSALQCNLVLAAEAKRGHRENLNEMFLVGSGALFGAGKTTIASVVVDGLRQYLGAWDLPDHRGRVVHSSVGVIHLYQSYYHLWNHAICAPVELKDLAKRLRPEMCLLTLLRETEAYLEENQLVLFLHLDEFEPFATLPHDPTTVSTRDLFYTCWQKVLMPILTTPRVCLYISGRMPYFDTVGTGGRGSPCQVMSPILELFSDSIIHSALDKMYVASKSNNGVPEMPDDAPVLTTLTDALDRLLPAVSTGASNLPGSWAVAQRIKEATGGVPRSVCYALHQLLLHPVLNAALFEGETGGVNASTLDDAFSHNGAIQGTLRTKATKHFNQIVQGLRAYGDPDSLTHHMGGFLRVLFLSLSNMSIALTDANLAGIRTASGEGQLPPVLEEAQYWGIHCAVNATAKTASFPLPPAALTGVRRLLSSFGEFGTLKGSVIKGMSARASASTTADPLGDASEQAVENALVFYAHMAPLIHASNRHCIPWEEEPTAAVTDDGDQVFDEKGTAFSHWPRVFELPCLPVVRHDGRLSSIQEIESITFARAADPGTCTPALAGAFLASPLCFGNKSTGATFGAFRAGLRSACADFFLRITQDLYHMQVKGGADAVKTNMLVKELRKAAPVVRGAPGLRHTVVMIFAQPEQRAAAVAAFGAHNSSTWADVLDATQAKLEQAVRACAARHDDLVEAVQVAQEEWSLAKRRKARRRGAAAGAGAVAAAAVTPAAPAAPAFKDGVAEDTTDVVDILTQGVTEQDVGPGSGSTALDRAAQAMQKLRSLTLALGSADRSLKESIRERDDNAAASAMLRDGTLGLQILDEQQFHRLHRFNGVAEVMFNV